MTTRRFGFPEKLWVAYTLLILALILGASVGRILLCGVLAQILSFPAGWLLSGAAWYSNLPQEMAYVVFLVVAVANGGLFYGALKIVMRKRSPK